MWQNNNWQHFIDKVGWVGTACRSISSNGEANTNSLIVDKVADGYIKIADFKSAIAAMEQALVKGQEELKDERYKGCVFDYTVEGYKTKIQELKKKI
ncbi:hypothetical protein [Pedobacter africanus]|uniref:Uncharacterized protein n=1 Tax=Pedobacter africanus TaxID=151894 RepID=A0A1W1ZVP1_9SPHI|nr:hypothetical protein [Pedobacter africanus]SMC52312.1 hypothetical protein SAMN04488524_1004 [Pedobacter africanus]